jgi:flagellin
LQLTQLQQEKVTMALSILNNIAALYAENNLNATQSNLQTTLQQLSSGSRINSGADDPAGLAVSDGLGANEAALTQSSKNATDGVGLLQTADGALSQVTSLLDQAVTLATQASNGTLTAGQVSSANQEYQNILTQIGNIGSTTNFNSNSVFTATATNVVVTDGTSSGVNTYADTIGILTTGSVGTTAGSAIVATTVAPVTTQAGPATTKVAGVYTLTPTHATDTLSGQLSLTVGSGTEIDVTVAAGTTTSALATQLSGNSSFSAAGLSATVNNGTGVLTITGPTTGATAASNTVAFTHTALNESPAATAVTGAVGTAASVGTAAAGTLTIAGASANDLFGGAFTLTQGSNTLAITITAGSNLASVQTQIATQVTASNGLFALGTTTGTATNPIYNFTGANNTTPVTITSNTLADATTVAATATGGSGTAGTGPAAGTYALSALGSSTDTFGTGSVLTVGGQAISLDGLTGTTAAAAITANTTLAAAGVTAAFNTSTKVLTITGNASGAALTVTGASTLGDVSSAAPASVSTLATGTAASGNSVVTAGNSVISLLGAADTLSGTLNVQIGTGNTAKTASLVIKAGTTGSELAAQIGQSTAFTTAGVTAAYNSTTNAVTLTGPTGTTSSLDQFALTGTITDSSASTPGAGANFNVTGISQLTSANAASILTTVTSAVADVAYQRGTVGADINELTSAANVASSEQVNLTSAQDSITATDYGQAASNLSKYQILSQTGISALAQANSVQQEVLKLLQ